MTLGRLPWLGAFWQLDKALKKSKKNNILELTYFDVFKPYVPWAVILKQDSPAASHSKALVFGVFTFFDHDGSMKEGRKFDWSLQKKQKIVAAVNNAQRFITIREKYGTFSQYIWNFVEGKPLQNSFKTLEEIPAKTPLSEKISKDLKQNGFQFVGPTVVYAHMQATGMVNDHLVNCHRYGELSH